MEHLEIKIRKIMIKKLREYIKIILIVTGILATGSIGGAVLVKTEVGLKAVDAVLEQFEPTPTPEAIKAKK